MCRSSIAFRVRCDFAYKKRLTLPCTNALFFSAKHRVDRKASIIYYLKTPFSPISANLTVFCRSVTRLKTRARQAGAGFVRKIAWKSFRNRIKNCTRKRALRDRCYDTQPGRDRETWQQCLFFGSGVSGGHLVRCRSQRLYQLYERNLSRHGRSDQLQEVSERPH